MNSATNGSMTAQDTLAALEAHAKPARAALVITLPWAQMRHPSPADRSIRERLLGWAAGRAGDPEWFIQKAVARWLRDLSRRDPQRTAPFLESHGKAMKPFARHEAARYLSLR